MKKKLSLWLIILPPVLIILIFGAIFVYFSYFYYEPYSSGQPETGGFLIDPETIINSINNGDVNIFSPILETAELRELVFDKPIHWRTEDFTMVSEALNQKVWKDTLNDWNLYEMSFSVGCQDNMVGFEGGYLSYFKAVPPEKSYMFREFSITLRYGYVEWKGGRKISRPLFGWKSVDQDNLAISAIDALEIAEENGGKDIRLKFNNECAIKLSFSPEKNDGWYVRYTDVDNLPIFRIVIDPFTGKTIK